MSTLVVRLSDLATRIATECKSIRTLLNGNAADLTALTTTTKTSLVAALNEVKTIADAAGGGASINDTVTNTTTVWSSSKTSSEISTAVSNLVNGATATLDTLNELAAALGNDANFATTTATALGSRLRYDASQTLSAAQMLQACTNLGIGNPDTDFVTTFNSGLV